MLATVSYDEVAAQTMKVLEALADAGASVEEVSLGWARMSATAARYLDHLMGSAREVEAHPDLVCDYTAFYAERSGTTTAEQFLWLHGRRGRRLQPLRPAHGGVLHLYLPHLRHA
ncbi:MAG: hypothetical protein R3D84_15795 [Paracoccaceae bacterium]